MKKNSLLLTKWMLLPSMILVLLTSCEKWEDNSPIIEEVINLSGFSKVYAAERFNLVISKGNDFSIKVKGPANSVHDMALSVANNILDIRYVHQENNRPQIDVFITLPVLVAVNLSGAGTGTVAGFQGVPNVIRTVLSGASELTINGTGINTQIEISGASELNVTGETASLFGNISGAGKLNAYGLTATEVDISASGASEARVKVVQTLFASATGGSKIYFKGNPPVRNIETSGGGEVIQQ